MRRRLPLAGGGAAVVVFTGAADGDLSQAAGAQRVAARRRAIVDLPWTSLHQVHGAQVVTVRAPGDHAGERADGAVTDRRDTPIAVHTADCAPVALVADEGVLGVVHAGWRGLVAGVIPAAVEAMRALGAQGFRAMLGPCIHAARYEFGADDLDRVAATLGDEVRARTEWGTPALDVPAAVRISLERCGIDRIDDVDICTAADAGYFSHRARRDAGRQALVAWLTA